MIAGRIATVFLAGSCAWPCTYALAQDNPILRESLEQKIVEELAKHHSEETAWYREKSVDRQKWTSGHLLGRKIRLASWTEQSKSWIWLEEPDKTISFDLHQLTFRDGRVEFAVKATARARFKVWGRIPKLIQAAVGGTALVRIKLEGSTTIADGRLAHSKISKLNLRLDDLQFNNPLGGPWEDLAKDGLNDYAQDKKEKLRSDIERAIDRVKF